MARKLIRTAGALAFGAFCAQASMAAEDEWQHTAAIYLVGASIEGQTGIGNVIGDIDVGFDDILDKLKLGGMGAYRGERGRWAVVADFIYMDLEQKNDGLGPGGQTSNKVTAEQIVAELDGSYALTDRLDAYAGLRYWELDTKIELFAGGPLGLSGAARLKEDWIDPLVGLRWLQPLGDKWQFMIRGDIGGFGVGSDFSWHTTALFSRTLGEHASLLLGFRYLDVDYDDGEGIDRFVWDVGQGGPTIGVAWAF